MVTGTVRLNGKPAYGLNVTFTPIPGAEAKEEPKVEPKEGDPKVVVPRIAPFGSSRVGSDGGYNVYGNRGGPGLRPGRYASLGDTGLNDRISSIGGGSGRTLATAGGAVAGAAIGANTGRSNQTEMRDVNRCESVSSTVPTYWDISYRFRGIDHQTQMDSQPGRTVTVNANANANANGEPRL